MKKTVIYAVLLSLISLAAGTALGVAIERTAKEHRRHGFVEMLRQGRKKFEGRKEGTLHQKILQKLSQKLNLTPAQQEKVKAILEDAQAKVRETRDGVFVKLTQIRKESSAKIEELLDPEQKVKYEQMMQDLKKRFAPKGRLP